MLAIRGFQCSAVLFLLLAFSTAEAATVEFETAGFTLQVDASAAQKIDLDWPAIDRLYETLGGRFIWHESGALSGQGRLLFAWLAASGAEGLNPNDYHVSYLRLLQRYQLPGDHLLRELLLTDGYLRLAVDLRQGKRAARLLDPFWKSQAEPFDPVTVLIQALARDSLGAMLDGLTPAIVDYRLLRQALAHYRSVEEAGGWPILESDQSLMPGQRAPQVSRLRERLALEAGQPVGTVEDPDYFDRILQADLQRFQLRHGLKADGVMGPATLEALNVSVSMRIAQLRANLERWRWLPHELEAEYLLVNTAGFDITLQSHQQQIFSGRTVNGSKERQTPSMVSRITHLVANPQWSVPRRIAVEDMLPHQQADPGYLSGKKIRPYRRTGSGWEVFDPQTIDWSIYNQDNFPFILKQDAGATNSLGRIKFYMPNRRAVFLHDTPAVGLFGRSYRALSSGCVRVEGADRLARLLITRADPWAAGRFSRAMQTGETLEIKLKEPIPVYLTYFTSWVDATGEVHFRPDIYRRDASLMMAIGSDDRAVMVRLAGDAVPVPL